MSAFCDPQGLVLAMIVWANWKPDHESRQNRFGGCHGLSGNACTRPNADCYSFDGCGIAPINEHGFLISDGGGGVSFLDHAGGQAEILARSPGYSWGNHLTRLAYDRHFLRQNGQKTAHFQLSSKSTGMLQSSLV